MNPPLSRNGSRLVLGAVLYALAFLSFGIGTQVGNDFSRGSAGAQFYGLGWLAIVLLALVGLAILNRLIIPRQGVSA